MFLYVSSGFPKKPASWPQWPSGRHPSSVVTAVDVLHELHAPGVLRNVKPIVILLWLMIYDMYIYI